MTERTRPSRGEFYAMRDKRTRTEANGDALAFRAAIQLDPATSATYAAQVTAMVLGNILSRFCPNVVLLHPGPVRLHDALRGFPGLPAGSNSLIDALVTVARGLDPFGTFDSGDGSDLGSGRHVIDVAPVGDRGAAFHVSAHGWTVRAGTEFVPGAILRVDDSLNPVGPAFAACLAAADAFRVALDIDVAARHRDVSLNLWAEDGADGPELAGPALTAPVPIGRVLLAGLGGVGGSLAYLAGLTPLRGQVSLVDHDAAEYSNLNRTLSLSFGHAVHEIPKVVAARPFLERSGLAAYAFPCRLDEYYELQCRLPGDCDVVLALANEHGSYRVIQGNYPPTVVHASTSPNWGITLGHHRPMIDPCIAGLYPDAQVPTSCERGAVVDAPGATERAVGSLPFLAPAAATMLLAHVLRQRLGAAAPKNALRSINLLAERPTLHGFPASHGSDCMCRFQDQRLHGDFLRPSVIA